MWKVVTSNDGGSRPVPSVPFWKGNFMVTIDGDSLKIGFSYCHEKHEVAKELKNILIEKINDSGIIKDFGGKPINNSIKNDKISSVISLVSYDLKYKNWTNKSDFINDAALIFNTYYKIYHQQESLINQLQCQK
jgi:hypothetical protein